MQWLNYHHLKLFWMVAREGSVTRASQRLRLAQPTVSAQLRTFERDLGETLLEKRGRNLVLTEAGRNVLQYAEEIFALGQELHESVKGRAAPHAVSLSVGVADAVPKLVAYRLLRPALSQSQQLRLECREGRHEQLLSALSVHELDVVLSDSPLPAGSGFRAYSHLLGECTVSVFGTVDLVRRYKRSFPKSLTGAPLLVPLANSPLRRSLGFWLEDSGIQPNVVGEFEDSALLKTFGRHGVGLFVAPTIIAGEIESMYQVKSLGAIAAVKERFYVISPERRIKHPGVVAITQAARQELFS
ncbi:MAG: transcriptional activator NhaR [Acidobacteriota bacterium]